MQIKQILFLVTLARIRQAFTQLHLPISRNGEQKLTHVFEVMFSSKCLFMYYDFHITQCPYMTIFQLYDHTPYLRATTLLYVLLFDCSSRLSIDLERSYALWSVQIGFTIVIAEKKTKKKQWHEIHVRSKSISSQRVKLKHFCKKPEIEIEQLN